MDVHFVLELPGRYNAIGLKAVHMWRAQTFCVCCRVLQSFASANHLNVSFFLGFSQTFLRCVGWSMAGALRVG